MLPPLPAARSRRDLLRTALGAGALVSLAGCAKLIPYDMQPGSLKKGSRVHAFQTASFSYAFMAGQTAQWRATIRKVEQDTPAMMNALRESGHAMQIIVTPRLSNPDKAPEYQVEYYDADLVFVPAGVVSMAVNKPTAPAASATASAAKGPAKPTPRGKGNQPATTGPAAGGASPAAVGLRGRAGTAEPDYQRMVDAAGKALGLDPAMLRRGHFAVYGLVNMMTALNASNDSLQRHAFALLVLREKIKNGEKADWFGGNRPPEETLQDIEVALRVIAEHHASMAAFRTEVLGVVAMVNGYKATDAIDLLRAQLADSQQRNEQWINTHHQPQMEEFGVAMNEFRLPTPDVLLERLDESGYLSAALTIARGVATGSVSTTLDGLTKLAPRDSSARIVLEGLTASSRGDVMGAVDAVVRLGGKAKNPLAERLTQLSGAVGSIKGGAAQVASALGKPPGDLEGIKSAAQNLDAGADKLKGGAQQLAP